MQAAFAGHRADPQSGCRLERQLWLPMRRKQQQHWWQQQPCCVKSARMTTAATWFQVVSRRFQTCRLSSRDA
eukprot:363336-Chlamydomonas_euryale.AAC.7